MTEPGLQFIWHSSVIHTTTRHFFKMTRYWI